MDKFTAVTIWEKEKARIVRGVTRVRTANLKEALPQLEEYYADMWNTFLCNDVVVSRELAVYMNNMTIAEEKRYAIKLDKEEIVANVKNKRLLLSCIDVHISLGMLDTITKHNKNSFLLLEDYLRNTKQRRTKLYKHVVKQLAESGIIAPMDYSKSEWKAVVDLYNNSLGAKVLTTEFQSSLNFTFKLKHIEYICSYNSVIAIESNHWVLIGEDFDYSLSTSKHLNAHLGYTSSEVRQRIATIGNYIYLPLLTNIIRHLNGN